LSHVIRRKEKKKKKKKKEQGKTMQMVEEETCRNFSLRWYIYIFHCDANDLRKILSV